MEDQRLQRKALIAEVISGIAIVITLAFLAIEMRGNTNAIQAQTYQALMQQLNDYCMWLASPELDIADDRRDQVGWENLSRTEQQRVRLPALVNWGIYESAYFAYERDVLGDAEWQRFETAICRRFSRDNYLWSPEEFTSMEELLTPQFVKYICANCELGE